MHRAPTKGIRAVESDSDRQNTNFWRQHVVVL